MTPDEITRRVTASRAAQGLPPKVEDPAILAKVATLLASAAPRTDERRPTTGRLIASTRTNRDNPTRCDSEKGRHAQDTRT